MKTIYDMSKSELAKKFNCKESEVLYADEIIDYKDLKKAKVIKGFLSMEKLELTGLGNVEVIIGDCLNIYNKGKMAYYALAVGDQVKSLGKLKAVYGNIYLGERCDVDFGELTNIYGNLYFNHTKIKSMGKIENIYGTCSFDYSLIEDLGDNIKHIDTLIVTTNFKLKRFGSLESVKDPIIITSDEYDSPRLNYNMDIANKSRLVRSFEKEFVKEKNSGRYLRDPKYLKSLGL